MSKRLEKICSALQRCNTLCDVGCDHGYIGIEALASGVADRVVFVDISNDCLQKARRNCNERLIERASFVCQDGLGDIECDCAVIAGMGGLEIISILEGAAKLPKRLVLQPMRNQYDLRARLCQNYKITSDFKFCDGKFYDLIVAELVQGGSKLTEQELLFGKTNLENPSEDYVDFLRKEQQKLTKIQQGCQDNDDVKERIKNVERALALALK